MTRQLKAKRGFIKNNPNGIIFIEPKVSQKDLKIFTILDVYRNTDRGAYLVEYILVIDSEKSEMTSTVRTLNTDFRKLLTHLELSKAYDLEGKKFLCKQEDPYDAWVTMLRLIP